VFLVLKDFLTRHRLLCATAFLWWFSGAFQIFALGWIALTPFFISLHGLDRKARFRRGYATGFFCFWLINWWLVPTISRGAPAIGASVFAGLGLSLVAVTFIAAVHAFQVAFVALFWRGSLLFRVVSAAVLWAMGDYARTLTPLAHEWGAMAFSQTSNLPFLQVAGVLGQHGITFFCVFFAACVAVWWQSRDKKWLLAPTALFLALHMWGGMHLAKSVEGKPLRVLVVQTAVSSLRKTGRAGGEAPFPQAFRLTSEFLSKAKEPFDLVVWPETTANLRRFGTIYNGLDWEIWRREGPKVPLLIGAQTYDERDRSWNEAVLIAPDGTTQTRAKSRLVPFGERAPLVEWLPFLQIFAPRPMLEAGDGAKTFDLMGKTTLDTQICFESCFPQKVRGRLLVMLTNDEWFTGTEAPRQHRAMAIMRAVENGVPLVQSANGGYSFAVTARGQVTMTTEFGLPQTLDTTVLVAP
jgi:apolipoprotein N-acyltransferase